MTTLNIQDYGATPDDGTEDTQAIRDALADASSGDTVYFPEGTYDVRADDPSTQNAIAITINGDIHADNLTLAGDGGNSIIRLMGDHTGNHHVIRVYVKSGIPGLTIRDLRIDGNKSSQSATDGGHNIHIGNANDGITNDILIENVWTVDASQNNLKINVNGVSVNRVTTTGAGDTHGIGVDVDQDVTPRVTIRNVYSANNAIHGLDAGGGNILVEDSVFENNGWGGKTTHEVRETTYRRVRFKNNDHMGYMRNGVESTISQRAQVTFEDCISENNGWAGFVFGEDTDYSVGTILAVGNNETDSQTGNILVKGDSTLGATEIRSHDAANGSGLHSATSGSAQVDTYKHSGNPDGALNKTQNLSIGTQENTSIENITSVPTASDVGAGTGDSTSPGDGDDGTIDSTGGVLSTL